MPRVRANGGSRWAQRTAAATQDYQAGVQAPRVSWQQATVAASEAHKQAVIQAAQEGRFAKGVQKAGDAKWLKAASGKGAERFGPGAAAGQGDYEQGVAPYLQVIESTPLPPRGPKGDPKNIQRVAVLATALHKRKTGFSLVVMLATIAVLALIVLGMYATVTAGALRPRTPGSSAEFIHTASPWKRLGSLMPAAAVVSLVIGATLMMVALDTVSFSATAAPAGGAAMAAVAGDPAQVRNVPFGQEPMMLTHWLKAQTAGFYQWTHPTGHDVQRGFRGRDAVAAPLPMMATGYNEPLEPQEAISASIGAGAVAGDVELLTFLLYYPNLPGIDARMIDLSGLEARLVDFVTVEDTTTATAGGVYSGSRALNAGSDLLLANTDYAILGAHIGGICGALTVRGTDTGNLRVGIPGIPARPDITARWFMYLTEETGIPLIPVVNSANKAAIFIENITDENLVAVPFALVLARLSMG